MVGRSGGPLGTASIRVSKPQKDTNGQNFSRITYDFPMGIIDSVNQNSALVRPFRRAIADGKSVGKTTFVFHHNSNGYFVLGSFAHTDKISRTIFFPGLNFSRIKHTPDGKDLAASEIHNMDHLTLEKNLTDWHVTLDEKRTQGI